MNSGMRVLEGDFIDGGSADPDLDAAFAEFRESLGEGEQAEGTMSAYKIPLDKDGNPIAKTAKQSWMFTVPVGALSLVDIIGRVKREFMREGELIAVIRLTGHRPGKRGNEFNKIIRIEKENEPQRAAPTPGQTDVAALMRSMSEMMATQQARNDQLLQQIMKMQMDALSARVQPVASPGTSDPMQFMERMMLMQATMQRMQSIFAAPAAPAGTPVDPMAQLLSTMRTMKQVQEMMAGNTQPAEGDDSLLSGISKLAGPVLGLLTENEKTKRVMIEKGMVRRAVPANRHAPAPGAAHAPVTVGAARDATATTGGSAEESSTDGAEEMNLAQIRDTLKSLCEMAAEGTTPEDAAALVLDQLPEESDQQIAALVSEENKVRFLSTISTAYAGCREHAEWFEQLRVCLDAAFESDPDATAH